MSASISSPTAKRPVLSEISNSINSPTKRKLGLAAIKEHDVDCSKKRVRYDSEGKENHTIPIHLDEGKMGLTEDLQVEAASGTKAVSLHLASQSDRTVSRPEPEDNYLEDSAENNPHSEATVTDPDLPSSSSGLGEQRLASNLQSTSKNSPIIHDVEDSARVAVSSLKCRLQLAMYKLRSHKEDLSYKSLVPRQLLSGKVEERQSTSLRPLNSQCAAPKPMTSNLSDERSHPGLLVRSSSGSSITETPIRRNYDEQESPAPGARRIDPYLAGERLPGIQARDPVTSQGFMLPPISSLTPASASRLGNWLL